MSSFVNKTWHNFSKFFLVTACGSASTSVTARWQQHQRHCPVATDAATRLVAMYVTYISKQNNTFVRENRHMEKANQNSIWNTGPNAWPFSAINFWVKATVNSINTSIGLSITVTLQCWKIKQQIRYAVFKIKILCFFNVNKITCQHSNGLGTQSIC